MISISVVFAIWFTLSVVTQFRAKCFRRLKSFDYCAILPAWTFFAPNPGVTDYILIYREHWADGGISDWKEADIGSRVAVLSAFWHPAKRRAKVLVDASCELVKYATSLAPQDIALVTVSPPYILFLRIIEKQRLSPFCEYIQFAIMQQKGLSVEKVIAPTFSSGIHRV
jgi:hypothetical protein